METLYIVIGAFSSIFIFLLGYAVSGVFNGKKKVDDLEKYIEQLDRNLSDITDSLHRRIDDDTKLLQSNIDENEKDIISLLDSRLDRLENKLMGLIPPTNDELMERIKKIEEESYRLRMNL